MARSHPPESLAGFDEPSHGIVPTGWTHGAEGAFTADFRFVDPLVQPALAVIQSLRISALAIADEVLRVPRDHRYVFRSFSAQTCGPVPPRAPRDSAAAVVTRTDLQHRRGQLVGAAFHGELRSAGVVLGRGSVEFGFLSAALFRFVRRSTGAPAAPDVWPGAVTSDRWHPAPERMRFRGEPADHIPGIELIAEALRLVDGDGGPGVGSRRFTGSFPRFAAPDLHCRFAMRRHAAEPETWQVRAVQAGAEVLTASLQEPTCPTSG